MPFISVGRENSADIQLYYEDHGSGRPVVLIHGYPLSGASWEKQRPALLDAGLRVVTYDRRGFGRSSQPATGYNYDTFAEDLRHILQHLKLDDVSLVGFSMGGGEVARYIGRHGTKGIRSAVFDGIEDAVRADRYAFFAGFFQNFFNTDALPGTRISEAAVKASWNVAAGSSAIASLACVATWYEDFRQDVAKIDVPTLVIHGDADRIVPLDASGRRTADLVKGAKLVTIKDGPHAVNWTHAEEVNRELVSFLKT